MAWQILEPETALGTDWQDLAAQAKTKELNHDYKAAVLNWNNALQQIPTNDLNSQVVGQCAMIRDCGILREQLEANKRFSVSHSSKIQVTDSKILKRDHRVTAQLFSRK
jgi:hypothetical protein